jgi:hypothetical protein
MGVVEPLPEIAGGECRQVIGQRLDLLGRFFGRLGRTVSLASRQLLEPALHRLVGVVGLLGGGPTGGFLICQLALQVGQFLPQLRLGLGEFLGRGSAWGRFGSGVGWALVGRLRFAGRI